MECACWPRRPADEASGVAERPPEKEEAEGGGCELAEEPWCLGRETKLRLDSALRLRADSRGRGLALLEEDHRRDRRDPRSAARPCSSSMLTFTSLSSSARSSAIRSSTGETAWHGAAPLCPEVDQDRLLASQGLLLEASTGHFDLPFVKVPSGSWHPVDAPRRSAVRGLP